MWDIPKGHEYFTPMTDKITYIGIDHVISTMGNMSLNGNPMEKGREYKLTSGDIIQDLDFKPINSKDLIWSFRIN